MKYLKYIALTLLLVLAFNNCERDDLCAESTPTTPSLIIRLHDISNEESTKNAFDLRVQGVGSDDVLPNYNVVSTDSIVLPLKTQASSTQYKLHSDYSLDDNGTPDDDTDDIISGNEDIITITYEAEDVYVSRACGFKTIYNNITITVEDDGDNWILDDEIVNTTIDNENAAHVKIFH